MNMNRERTAIVIVSFDKYSDIWDTFALCINRFWRDRIFNTYLVTNELTPCYNGISIITTGKETSWSERVNRALESIHEKYIILLLEDYLIDTRVDNELIESTIEHMDMCNIDYFRIVPIPFLKGRPDKGHAIPIAGQTLYGANLQAAIWKKSYLKEIVSKGAFSAWEFEARQKMDSPLYVEGKCVASDIYILHYQNGIIQGKWYSKTVEIMKSKGIDIPLGNRQIMTDKDMKRENARNFLLHHLPPWLINKLKPIAKKMGFKFVTD